MGTIFSVQVFCQLKIAPLKVYFKKKLVVELNLTFNWAYCILSGNLSPWPQEGDKQRIMGFVCCNRWEGRREYLRAATYPGGEAWALCSEIPSLCVEDLAGSW